MKKQPKLKSNSKKVKPYGKATGPGDGNISTSTSDAVDALHAVGTAPYVETTANVNNDSDVDIPRPVILRLFVANLGPYFFFLVVVSLLLQTPVWIFCAFRRIPYP